MRHCRQIALACVLLLAAPAAIACTQVSLQPLKLDPAESVFGGEVIGYSGPFRSLAVRGEMWGLRVRVTASAYMPAAVKEVEVFVFRHGPSCDTVATPRAELQQRFPLGQQAVFVAWPSLYGRGLAVMSSRGVALPTKQKAATVVHAAADLRVRDWPRRQFELHKKFARDFARARRQKRPSSTTR